MQKHTCTNPLKIVLILPRNTLKTMAKLGYHRNTKLLGNIRSYPIDVNNDQVLKM